MFSAVLQFDAEENDYYLLHTDTVMSVKPALVVIVIVSVIVLKSKFSIIPEFSADKRKKEF